MAQYGARKGTKVDFKDLDPKPMLEINGNKWIFTGKENGEIIAINSKSNPKCLDLKSVEEGRKGQVDEAIYKIDRDTFTICWYQGQGKQRPTEFKTSPEQPDTILMVFKRATKE